ncbi:DNA replication factor/protein phosphatase inhibitor SET/SPR-2 [Phaffia rhodozyma]|uniref:DNA replication factor/protein phosphatase inhibitor SET/SPR-2 n=1 Tax=Phaffia rhodozyma TaxID=264483 RepID=A0A0F7SWA8_PHARH|nr:DNA replication factor/protein phosphatase inhibitor SET/SPR-2 [Phaffia rhodozyma]
MCGPGSSCTIKHTQPKPTAMSTAAAKAVEKAQAKSDAWLEKNEEAVKSLRSQHLAVEAELEAKSIELFAAFYAKRRAETEKIPSFWLRAMVNHPTLAVFLQGAGDQEALTYLTDITLVRGGDKKDLREYDLIFTFAENPYFTEKTLTKSYTVKKEEDTEDEEDYELTGSVSTISWKDDAHNLVKANPQKIDEEEDNMEPGSFFNFFVKEEDQFAVGSHLRDEILPNALEFFAGLIDDSDDEFDGDLDDESDEEIDLDPRPKKKSKAYAPL